MPSMEVSSNLHVPASETTETRVEPDEQVVEVALDPAASQASLSEGTATEFVGAVIGFDPTDDTNTESASSQPITMVVYEDDQSRSEPTEPAHEASCEQVTDSSGPLDGPVEDLPDTSQVLDNAGDGNGEPPDIDRPTPADDGESERQGALFLYERQKPSQRDEMEAVVGYLRGNTQVPDDPADKMQAYLDFLAEEVNDGMLTGDRESIERQSEAHAINFADVPKNYRASAKFIEAIQNDQSNSLEVWGEHLGDNANYPAWFKHYAWEEVKKYRQCSPEDEKLPERSNSTVRPFPELNTEALSRVYEAICQSHIDEASGGGTQAEGPNDGPALPSGKNFGELYARATHMVAAELRDLTDEGVWIQFKADDPSVPQRLAVSLQGYDTGWCITATWDVAPYLEGDFYGYFTADRHGENTVPRIGITTSSDGKVSEVHGPLEAQNLEPQMADIAVARLRTLTGSEEYIHAAEDVKLLAEIEASTNVDPAVPLSDQQLRFLYELDGSIESLRGIEYGTRDPRIEVIRDIRWQTDREAVADTIMEDICELYGSAMNAYTEAATQLGIEQHEIEATTASFRELLREKEQEWRQADVHHYLAEELVWRNNEYILVATPDVSTDREQIVAMANAFAGDPETSNLLLLHSTKDLAPEFTAEDLSNNGNAPGGGPVRFSLVCLSLHGDHGETDGYNTIIRNRQEAWPGLHLQAPSVLDALVYWHTLQDQGYGFNVQNAVIGHHATRRIYSEEIKGLPILQSDVSARGGRMTRSLQSAPIRLAIV